MGKVSAFAEGGIGPAKCIPHHTKSVANRTVILLEIMFLSLSFVLRGFMFEWVVQRCTAGNPAGYNAESLDSSD